MIVLYSAHIVEIDHLIAVSYQRTLKNTYTVLQKPYLRAPFSLNLSNVWRIAPSRKEAPSN